MSDTPDDEATGGHDTVGPRTPARATTPAGQSRRRRIGAAAAAISLTLVAAAAAIAVNLSAAEPSQSSVVGKLTAVEEPLVPSNVPTVADPNGAADATTSNATDPGAAASTRTPGHASTDRASDKDHASGDQSSKDGHSKDGHSKDGHSKDGDKLHDGADDDD